MPYSYVRTLTPVRLSRDKERAVSRFCRLSPVDASLSEHLLGWD
jgi:hypothetical protein